MMMMKQVRKNKRTENLKMIKVVNRVPRNGRMVQVLRMQSILPGDGKQYLSKFSK